MNPWQYAQQLRHLLETVTWPTADGQVVFGSNGVSVFAGVPTPDHVKARFPFALVGIQSGAFDQDDPNLLTQTFAIMSVASVHGDPLGEQAIMGGPAADLNTSKGRGAAELGERARFALRNLNGGDGAKLQATGADLSTPATLQGRHIVVDEWGLTAICTSDLEYAEPAQLKKVGNDWTWAGAHCSNRFDFVQFKLGYVDGTTPAVDPQLAVVVYEGADPFVTVASVAGKAYSIWAEYSARDREFNSKIEGASDGTLVGVFLTT